MRYSFSSLLIHLNTSYLNLNLTAERLPFAVSIYELIASLERGLEGLDVARSEWGRTSQKAQRIINRIIVLRGQRRLLTVRMTYLARLRAEGLAPLEAELAELEGRP